MRKLNRKLSPYTTEIYKVILQKNNLIISQTVKAKNTVKINL